jgi:hypothetical protein
MIKIEKSYWVLVLISILEFVFLILLNYISDLHFKLNEQEIKGLNTLAENNNLTAVARLTNYYYFVEKDHNKTADVYRKYKDVNPKIAKALCVFLEEHGSAKQKDECNDSKIN